MIKLLIRFPTKDKEKREIDMEENIYMKEWEKQSFLREKKRIDDIFAQLYVFGIDIEETVLDMFTEKEREQYLDMEMDRQLIEDITSMDSDIWKRSDNRSIEGGLYSVLINRVYEYIITVLLEMNGCRVFKSGSDINGIRTDGKVYSDEDLLVKIDDNVFKIEIQKSIYCQDTKTVDIKYSKCKQAKKDTKSYVLVFNIDDSYEFPAWIGFLNLRDLKGKAVYQEQLKHAGKKAGYEVAIDYKCFIALQDLATVDFRYFIQNRQAQTTHPSLNK